MDDRPVVGSGPCVADGLRIAARPTQLQSGFDLLRCQSFLTEPALHRQTPHGSCAFEIPDYLDPMRKKQPPDLSSLPKWLQTWKRIDPLLDAFCALVLLAFALSLLFK